jgi:hypothetical protein
MLSLPPAVKIYLCVAPTDMRKSFDSLAILFTAEDLSLLLWGIDPSRVRRQKRYCREVA